MECEDHSTACSYAKDYSSCDNRCSQKTNNNVNYNSGVSFFSSNSVHKSYNNEITVKNKQTRTVNTDHLFNMNHCNNTANAGMRKTNKVDEKADENKSSKYESYFMSSALSLNHSEKHSAQFLHRKTARKVHRAKKQHRTDISPDRWEMPEYLDPSVCTKLFDLDCYKDVHKNIVNIDRIHRKDITIADFIERYEKPGIPVIIEGCIDEWPAMKKWNFKDLEKTYRRASFKVGENDDGNRIKMRMKYFMDYLLNQKDASPLYLFESCVEDYADTVGLLNDWKVPDMFPYDFHRLIGEEKRPPHRWFCIGPRRSGTTLHIDPLGTSAWNALVLGHKRWALFAPSVRKRIVKGRDYVYKGEDDEAIMYFHKILPRLLKAQSYLTLYQCIQKSGDVIFVPPNWWHGVLNLDDTVACTQNFVSYANFDIAWKSMRSGRPRLAVFWLKRLKRFLSDLYIRALYLNRQDKWILNGNCFMRMDGRENTSSSSSSSSSSSESSEDEDELAEIHDYVKSLKTVLPNNLSKIDYFEYYSSDGEANNEREKKERSKFYGSGVGHENEKEEKPEDNSKRRKDTINMNDNKEKHVYHKKFQRIDER